MSPTPEPTRWERIEDLFYRASLLPAGERLAFVRAQAGGEDGVAAEVVALLASGEEVARLIETGPALDDAADPWIGRRLGAFRLSALLGQGGMGRVYRAEREHGEAAAALAIDQTVAIKLMAFQLPSRALEQQFLEERTALASLEHRHIASLIDGGLTEEGLPYLAMEYVEGSLLDQVCDAPGVRWQTVLGYALQLCDAVAYVHRRLLLHRDLKPGNVLVTPEGTVKLLDFGNLQSLGNLPAIANPPTPDPLRTRESTAAENGLRTVTIRYASPEHLLGRETSTASDVFSLGMTLYRILLGRLPEELAASDVGEAVRLLEEQRLRPVAPALERRWGMPARVARDLEAILRRALAFAPEHRYQSVDAMAADLRATEQRRPLHAMPATKSDRARRFVERHRAAVLLAAVAAVLLVAVMGTMLYQERMARAARARAERGLLAESELNHFLLVDFFEQLRQLPESTGSQRQAVSEAMAHADRLAALSDRREVQLDRVQAYTEMGALLGDPYENNLDDAPGGVRTLEKAVGLAQALHRAAPADDRIDAAEAEAQHVLGETLFGMGRPQEAARYLRPAAETKERLALARPLNAATRAEYAAGLAEAAATLNTLGDVYFLGGAVSLYDPETSVLWARRALALERKGLAIDAGCARCRRGVAVEDWKLGLQAGSPTEALQLFADGLAALAAFSPEERQTARVRRLDTLLRQRVGWAEMQMGRKAEGLAKLSEMRARMQQSAAHDPADGRGHFDLMALDLTMAEGLDSVADRGLLRELGQESLDSAEALVRLDPGNEQNLIHLANAQHLLSRAEQSSGQAAQAAVLNDRAATAMTALARAEKPSPVVLDGASEALVLAHREGALAEQFAREAMGPPEEGTASQWMRLAEAEQMAGHADAARASARRGLALAQARPDSVERQTLLRRAHAVLKGTIAAP